MTKREFTGRGGEVWSWEETPETVAAVKKLHESSRAVEEVNKPKPKFAGNYKGPLYAPHPDLKRPEYKKVVITDEKGNEE
tara:strand:- start:9146 stop:9385 length:240 start_codon:yes stop_codon:yes gene_type:complete